MKNKKIILGIFWVIIWISIAYPQELKSPIQLIEEAFQSSHIDLDTKLLYQLYALERPELLPPKFKALAPERFIIKCATPIYIEIEINWDRLRPQTQEEIRTILKPPSDLREKYRTTHFIFYYARSGPNAVPPTDTIPANGIPDYVEDFGKYFEYAWNFVINTLGYKEPPRTYPRPIPVYIRDLERRYGWTNGRIIVVENDYREFSKTPKGYMQVTAAHEFFHAVQFAYDKREDQWWMEASATWMEDEVYDNVNDYIGYLTDWFNHPELPLDYDPFPKDLHKYGSCIYAKHLSEDKGVGIIKRIWENCKGRRRSLEAIERTLGGREAFKDDFQNFTVDNFVRIKKAGYGYEEGSLYPPIRIESTYPIAPNAHYVGSPPFPSKYGDKLSMLSKRIPHLASHYLKFKVPSKVDKPTDFYLNFKAGRDFGGMVVLVKNNNRIIVEKVSSSKGLFSYLEATEEVSEDVEVLKEEESKGVSTMSVSLYYKHKFGGDRPEDIKEIIFIPSNLAKRGDPRPYEYSAIIIPQFRDAYTPNPKNGTTKTVFNLDDDNVYRNGETIKIKVKLSYQAKVTADFSKVDSNYREGSEKVTEQDTTYTIEYTISKDNTITNNNLPVIIKVEDFTKTGYNIDDSFKIQVRVRKVEEKIVFVSDRDGNWEIYTMDTDGANQTRLTHNTIMDSRPIFSPDGTKIAFISGGWGATDLLIMDKDGGNRRNLTNNPSFIWGNPSFSPDGSKIAFTWGRDRNWEIYVVRTDGTGSPVNLTNNPDYDDANPCFSPDGKKIVFNSEPSAGGDCEIYLMNADGTGKVNLTNNPSRDESRPYFSPDGTKIVYHCRINDDREIFIMNRDGTGKMNLTNSPTSVDIFWGFSPDGKKILFASLINGYWEIFIMNVDGTGKVNLTNTPYNNDWAGRWSPDGNKILFISDRDGNWEIYKMDIDGSSLKNLTNNPALDGLGDIAKSPVSRASSLPDEELSIDTNPPPEIPTEGSPDIDADTDGAYTIYWSKINDSIGYEIQERINNGPWVSLSDMIPGDQTSYSVSKKAKGNTYYYRIRARNDSGVWSPWSGSSDGVRIVDHAAIIPTTGSSFCIASNNGKKIWVSIPANTFNEEITFTMTVLEPPITNLNTASSPKISQILAGSTFEFLSLNSNNQEVKPVNEITLTLPYLDPDPFDEARDFTYRVYRLNTALNCWEIVPGEQLIDPNMDTITIKTNTLSIYTVAQLSFLSNDLKDVHLYPNPYKPSKGHKKVTFKNLTPEVRIRIYNLAGELVFDKEYTTTTGLIDWECKNDAGNPLASGVYIYIITNDNGDKAIGKLSIIK